MDAVFKSQDVRRLVADLQKRTLRPTYPMVDVLQDMLAEMGCPLKVNPTLTRALTRLSVCIGLGTSSILDRASVVLSPRSIPRTTIASALFDIGKQEPTLAFRTLRVTLDTERPYEGLNLRLYGFVATEWHVAMLMYGMNRLAFTSLRGLDPDSLAELGLLAPATFYYERLCDWSSDDRTLKTGRAGYALQMKYARLWEEEFPAALKECLELKSYSVLEEELPDESAAALCATPETTNMHISTVANVDTTPAPKKPRPGKVKKTAPDADATPDAEAPKRPRKAKAAPTDKATEATQDVPPLEEKVKRPRRRTAETNIAKPMTQEEAAAVVEEAKSLLDDPDFLASAAQAAAPQTGIVRGSTVPGETQMPQTAVAEKRPAPKPTPVPEPVRIALPEIDLSPLLTAYAEQIDIQAQALGSAFEIALRREISSAVKRVTASVNAEMKDLLEARISAFVKPKVTIIGLIPQQVSEITAGYAEFFDLRFYTADDYIPRITKVAKDSTYVMVMIGFVSHKITNAVSALPSYVPVNGSLSQLKTKLDQLVTV